MKGRLLRVVTEEGRGIENPLRGPGCGSLGELVCVRTPTGDEEGGDLFGIEFEDMRTMGSRTPIGKTPADLDEGQAHEAAGPLDRHRSIVVAHVHCLASVGEQPAELLTIGRIDRGQQLRCGRGGVRVGGRVGSRHDRSEGNIRSLAERRRVQVVAAEQDGAVPVEVGVEQRRSAR